MPIEDYAPSVFEHDGISHPVYRGGTGPGVLIMHEMPGMTPPCIRLADDVRAHGYTVYLPLFFGRPNEDTGGRRALSLCVSREFRCLSANESSPITAWLRALCRERIFPECGGPGVGAIGMCLTGGFVLSLMLEREVVAPVTSQPALPLMAFTQGRKSAFGVSPEEFEAARTRAASGVSLLGFRFTHDALCPSERFDRLEQDLKGFVRRELVPEHYGQPQRAHSVLTHHRVEEAVRETLAFLDQRLKP